MGIQEELKTEQASERHAKTFLRSIGTHLQEVAPQFGSLRFNFKDGRFINCNREETILADK